MPSSRARARTSTVLPFDGQTFYGMAIGYATAELLQKTGKELTCETIVETLEKGGLKGAGLVPMNFSKDNHSGYSGARVNVVKGGKQAYFGPTFTTDDGSGAVEEYTGEENTPPTDGMPTR